MKRSKVLLILNVPPPYGGGEIRAHYMHKYFATKAGYVAFCYSRKDSNKAKQGRTNIRNILWGVYLIVCTYSLLIWHRPRLLYLSLPKQFGAFLRTALIIEAAKILRVKVFGELAGASFQFLDNDDYKKKIGTFFLKKVDEIRVLGNEIKRNMQKYSIDRTTVVENGIWIPPDVIVDEEVFSRDTLNLLYVGALNFSKGVQNIVHAMYIARKKGLKLHLYVMGEWSNYKQKTEIEEFINTKSLWKDITFYGLVTGEEKWSIYRNAAILVHPTYWDGQPITILEAMGCGLAIISTAVGAIPDTVKNERNGIILKENSPKAVYEAMRMFHDNRDLLKRMSRTNHQYFKERYTISAYCQRMQSWFESRQLN